MNHLSEQTLTDMMRLAEEGFTAPEIASALHISKSAVYTNVKCRMPQLYNELSMRGNAVRGKTRKKMYDEEALVSEHYDGTPTKVIAERHGISDQTVRNVLRKSGINLSVRKVSSRGRYY